MRSMISGFERGKIFFAQDFTMLGTPDLIRYSLSELTKERFIVRLARGVYCYPKLVGEYKIQTIYPSADTVAHAIAEKSKIRIVPYAEQAAYLMGFTSLQLGRFTYLTDGAPRSIGVGPQGWITFKHTSEVRIFSFADSTMQLLSLAIRAIGAEGINPEVERKILQHLKKVRTEDFEHDIRLCPGWVSEILLDYWNSK